jgi:hypothetical protein
LFSVLSLFSTTVTRVVLIINLVIRFLDHFTALKYSTALQLAQQSSLIPMKFLNTLLGLSIAFVTGVAAIGDCDSGPFAALTAVGDKHDSSQYDVEICETQWTYGRVVRGVEVWGSKDRISGIYLTYSNQDHSHLVGARDGDYHQSLNWDPFTVSVTRTVLWSDRDANQLGGIRIELSNGESLEVKVDKISGKTFSPDVGSGIMLGGWGRADDHITAWGWLFLEDKVDKIQIGDFQWDQDQDEFAKSQAYVQPQWHV